MVLRRILACCMALLLQVTPPAAQQVTVSSITPTIVWRYSAVGAPCTADDYPDVPARPFLVGSGSNQTVLWSASNSSGAWASMGVGASPDILASLRRGVPNGPGCVSWLPAAGYRGTVPAAYGGGLWMVAPFTPDGLAIQALVHQEFHGEWSGSLQWCWQQQSTPTSIYLPCNYWNIVGALSTNAGQSFQLGQSSPGINMPAIALGQPYQPPPPAPPPVNLPQGMTAQSNILAIGGFLYALVQQLPYWHPGAPAPAQAGVCVYRTPLPTAPGAPLTWTGWGGSGYTVAVPTSYPGTAQPLCSPLLSSPFRFSWAFSNVGPPQTVILIGQDEISSVNTSNCPYAPGASAATADAAFVYATAILAPTGLLQRTSAETCLLQINSMANWQANPSRTGHAYPSLLDPTSPAIMPGDRNFQFTGSAPFLYFTLLNPSAGQPNNFNRDLVRLPLAVTAGYRR